METIKTLDDLQKYIEKWCNDPQSVSGDNESVFDGLLLDNQVIHITGDGYSSDITTGVMRQLVALQDQIYNLVRIGLYGSRSYKLDEFDERKLEFRATVKEGSSIIEVGIGDAIKKALERMNGWQIVGTAVIGIIVYAIMKCYSVSRNARKEEVKAIQETERLRITTEASKNNVSEALAVVKAVEESRAKALRYLSGTNADIEINGVKYSKEELLEGASDMDGFDYSVKEKEQNTVIEEGSFILDKFDNNLGKNLEPRGRKISIVNCDTQEHLEKVTFPEDMPEEDILKFILMASKEPVGVSVLVVRDSEGKPTTAKVVSTSIETTEPKLEI